MPYIEMEGTKNGHPTLCGCSNEDFASVVPPAVVQLAYAMLKEFLMTSIEPWSEYHNQDEHFCGHDASMAAAITSTVIAGLILRNASAQIRYAMAGKAIGYGGGKLTEKLHSLVSAAMLRYVENMVHIGFTDAADLQPKMMKTGPGTTMLAGVANNDDDFVEALKGIVNAMVKTYGAR